MSFTIFTDTSANLDKPLLDANGIGVIPFHYVYEGRELTCLDTEAFKGAQADEYYAALKAGSRVSTSQITPEDYKEYLAPVLERGEDLLFISMSSGISNSYNSSVIAVNELREAYPERTIRTVDTLGASLGEGIWVLRAIECRKKGMSLDETADFIEANRMSMYQVVLIEDLMYLHRGGRISAPKALLGKVLGIRPILKGDEGGHLIVHDKVRGRKHGLGRLAEKYEELVDRDAELTVGIAFTDCEADARALGEKLRSIREPKELMIVRYEPVTGSYVGPGTVALFFEGKGNVRVK